MKLLAEEFGAMVNNPHLSDVQFQVDSGEVLYAHMFVLYARCPQAVQVVSTAEIASPLLQESPECPHLGSVNAAESAQSTTGPNCQYLWACNGFSIQNPGKLVENGVLCLGRLCGGKDPPLHFTWE